jgi:hypothetical protein
VWGGAWTAAAIVLPCCLPRGDTGRVEASSNSFLDSVLYRSAGSEACAHQARACSVGRVGWFSYSLPVEPCQLWL